MEDKRPIENDLNAYWDSLRKRNFKESFPAVEAWIRESNKTVRRSRLERRQRRKRARWFALGIIPLFFILSCTIRVNRVEKSGSLVNFSIDKKEDRSFQKLSSLQQLFTFTCYEFLQPDQPTLAYFIFFIPNKEQEKFSLITRELKLLNGLQKLDISSINYTIRESLFLTFWHKTLQLGEQPMPKSEELTRNIQATLKDKGLDFLSIRISNDKDGNIEFDATKQIPDSLTITNKSTLPGQEKSNQSDKIRNERASMAKLQIFDWLIGSWRVKYVPQTTYHHWSRINDSLLICFIIKYKDEELIKMGDDGPDISVGFSLRYTQSDSILLSLRGIEWKFLSADDKEIHFKNDITPKSANVKWVMDNEKKSWQSAISGEGNLEVVNLIRDNNTAIENIVKEFVAKNPDVIKRS